MVWTGYGVKCFQKYQRFTALKPRGAHSYFHLSFFGTQRGRWWYLFLQYLEDIIFTYCRMGLRENTCLEIPGFWFSWQIGKGERGRGGGVALREGRSSLHLARFSSKRKSISAGRSPPEALAEHTLRTKQPAFLSTFFLTCIFIVTQFLLFSPQAPQGVDRISSHRDFTRRYLVRVLQAGCSVTA